jgi:hypothetical protein
MNLLLPPFSNHCTIRFISPRSKNHPLNNHFFVGDVYKPDADEDLGSSNGDEVADADDTPHDPSD